MEKIGIIVDSSSAYTKKEAEKKGFYFIPIVIEFNEEERFSGIDIDNQFLFKNMDPKIKVRTAGAKLGDIESTIEKASKENDKVLVITLSKGLSGINQSAKLVAKKFPNVLVYESDFISPWTYLFLEEIYQNRKKLSWKQLVALLDAQEIMYGFLIPQDLKWLYAGGRINKFQYVVGSAAKVTPIITVHDGVINAENVIKKRTPIGALEAAIKLTIEKQDELKDMGYESKVLYIDLNSGIEDEIFNLFEKYNIKNSLKTKMAPEIIAHIGPRSVVIGIYITGKIAISSKS